jgi:CRP/FNR family cyclic AMP-dependent transcriptional regulator
MRDSHCLPWQEDWRKRKSPINGFLGELSAVALKELKSLMLSSACAKGAILFMEGEPSQGIYILRAGQAKLSFTSRRGKTFTLRFAKPGEALGLTACLFGKPCEFTAEVFHPCHIEFVHAHDFLRFLTAHPEAYRSVARQISSDYQAASETLRTIGLGSHVTTKLAKLLLDWSIGAPETSDGICVPWVLTHEEVAACIGTTRESVTRAFTEFRNRRLVALKGSTVTIPNRQALMHLVAA